MPTLTILDAEPTTIAALEGAMVARLKERVGGVAVEPYPDRPEAYRLVHQAGALLVAYRGARYGEPESLGEVIQERTLDFDVYVLARSLGGHQGAYTYLEAARGALTGYAPEGFGRLTPVEEAFLAHGEGVWMYSLTLSATTVTAELGSG